jgi:hypothetical protein
VGSLYYAQAADVLRSAGVKVAESSINAGWERRARSSGGFSVAPLGCVWHHTASNTSPANDLSYMINGSDDAPIGNMLLDRDGVVWMIAAGGANTQGKGGPHTFSRGTVPLDSGNSQLWGIEVANSGTGQDWPQVQIDAYFKASNALNEMFGNLPTDLITHHEWAEDRKIDPATAAAVEGPWRPGSVTGSGTWNGNDIRNECVKRSGGGGGPTPTPTPPTTITEDEDMGYIAANSWDPDNPVRWYVTSTVKRHIRDEAEIERLKRRGLLPASFDNSNPNDPNLEWMTTAELDTYGTV